MKTFLISVATLAATSWILFNSLAGIVSGIWLIFAGGISQVVYGIILGIAMPWVYSLAFIPMMLFMPLLLKAVEGGHKIATSLMAFIAALYQNFIIALWIGFVFGIFAYDVRFPLIAILLWGYSVALSPIGYMAQKEGPDAGIGTSMGFLFAQVLYLILTINLLLGGTLSNGYSWVWIILIGYSLLATLLGVAAMPSKKTDFNESLTEPIIPQPDPSLVAKYQNDRDEIYPQAIEFLSGKDDLRAEDLQKKFNIGYSRAERILQHLVEDGYAANNNPDENVAQDDNVPVLTDDEKISLVKDSPFYKQIGMIESTLEAFGIQARVNEINIKTNGVEYRLAIAVGSPMDEIVKRQRDIAAAVESPTGKVKILAPIPGTSFVGITVPIKKSKNE
ncbi:MAG: hypothetical protein M1444_01220 [Patescibacteria group bacterium]|nr:hypothetical protein [Patescibacteria group bacterium]